jgi:hypothetical protein
LRASNTHSLLYPAIIEVYFPKERNVATTVPGTHKCKIGIRDQFPV